jgi:hypothetical protein
VRWKVLLLMPVLLLVLACGSSSNTSTSFKPTTLQVVRSSTLPGNNFPPLSRITTNANAVQKLYDAAFALPKASTTGTRNCPAADGLIYHLRFLQNRTYVQQMDMGPTGCPWITVNKDDMRVPDQMFFLLFAQTVGISPSQVIPAPIGESGIAPSDKRSLHSDTSPSGPLASAPSPSGTSDTETASRFQTNPLKDYSLLTGACHLTT